MRATLLLHHPGIYQGDTVRQAERFHLVVGDEQDGDVEPLLQQLDLEAHLLAQLGIEITEWLVQQQRARFRHQRPGEGHALLLAATEQRAGALFHAGHAHQLEDRRHPGPDFATGKFPRLQGKGDVFLDGHVRPDRVGLEHHADVAFFRGERKARMGQHHRVVAEINRTFVGLFQARDHAERRRLAAARRPQQGNHFPDADLQAQPIDGLKLAARIGLGEILKPDRHLGRGRPGVGFHRLWLHGGLHDPPLGKRLTVMAPARPTRRRQAKLMAAFTTL